MEQNAQIAKAMKLVDEALELNARAADKLLEAKLAMAAGPSTASVVKRLFNCWHELWKRRYNADYVFAGAKDGAQFKRLLKQMAGEDIAARMKRYLSDGDQWLVDRKHPLNIFISTISRYAPDQPNTRHHEEFELSAPVGCNHHPPCKSDVEHTRKTMREMREGGR